MGLSDQAETEGRPFAAPRDAAWLIEAPGFDVAREHEIESILSIANGYVGSRASLAEGTRASRPATLAVRRAGSGVSRAPVSSASSASAGGRPRSNSTWA